MKKLFTFLAVFMAGMGLMMVNVVALNATVGNDSTIRIATDTRADFVLVDTNNPADHSGLLDRFDYFATKDLDFYFLVIDNTNVIRWISDPVNPSLVPGVNTYEPVHKAYVEMGWNVGLYYPTTGVIPYNYEGLNRAYFTLGGVGMPEIGDNPIYQNLPQNRVYSYVAYYDLDNDDDGVLNDLDNCLHDYNPDQLDVDGDQIGDVCDDRYAEITAPLPNEIVMGVTEFKAYLFDNDRDSVQWAVRKGSCKANTGTVLGNVDGHNDVASWIFDGINTQNFLFSKDLSEFEEGDYCFVFNPTEDPGESDIRLTRLFKIVDPDRDDDGVPNELDLCEGTVSESSEGMGVNRWRWDGDSWMSLLPSGKSKKTGPYYNYNEDMMTDTMGCSCEQILAKIEELSGDQMEGHHKFGCSKSVVDDFIKDVSDGGIDGYNKNEAMETVVVPAYSASMPIPAVASVNSLMLDDKYLLKAYQTALAGDGIEFDAVCSFRTGSSSEWTDLVSNYASYGPELLDLLVNGSSDGWGNTCDASHIYYQQLMGLGAPASFLINDVYPYNNSGELKVDIFEWLY